MPLQSGHEVASLEGEDLKDHQSHFTLFAEGCIRLSPGGWIFPPSFLKFADKLYNFKFQADDVLVVTWPKCGTTWTQEIIWTMKNNPDLNNPEADKSVLGRSPFLDMDMLFPAKVLADRSPNNVNLKTFWEVCPDGDPELGFNIQIAEVLPSPRTLKTHLPLSLLDPSLLDTCKVLYVARNPLDVIVSAYHHYRLVASTDIPYSLQKMVSYFTNDSLTYGPYWRHLKEAWDKRDHPNLHFIFYEDLKADVMTELKKLDAFLGTGLNDKQLKNVAHHTSFSQMSARDNLMGIRSEDNPKFNLEVLKEEGGFFRKGEVSSYKEKLTPEMVTEVEEWTRKNLNDVPFKYSI